MAFAFAFANSSAASASSLQAFWASPAIDSHFAVATLWFPSARVIAASADTKTADASADAAVTRAEGNHKVATTKCELMAGDAQKACKDEADAALEMAKAKAKATKADQN